MVHFVLPPPSALRRGRAAASGRRKKHFSNQAGNKDSVAAVPEMTKLLDSKDDFVRREAAWAPGRIGPDAAAAIPDLTEALKDPSDAVRDRANHALERIRR